MVNVASQTILLLIYIKEVMLKFSITKSDDVVSLYFENIIQTFKRILNHSRRHDAFWDAMRSCNDPTGCNYRSSAIRALTGNIIQTNLPRPWPGNSFITTNDTWRLETWRL